MLSLDLPNGLLLAQTGWGQASLARAHKILIKAALSDPLNQQFQLLCDTVIPIRSPVYTYFQLIGHSKSRISDFPEGHEAQPPHRIAHRFPFAMQEAWPDVVKNTAGHSQWVTLNRRHATFVDQDDVVIDLFERFCTQAHER